MNMNSVSIFCNENNQRQFDIDGYVVIPFLSDEEVSVLKVLYAEVMQQIPLSFHSTSFIIDEVLKQNINQEIEKIYSAKTESLFHDIKKLGSSFLTKPTGVKGAMPVHQDWTIVDEEKF